MQACGWLLLTMVMPRLGGWGHLVDGSGWRPWAWGITAGCLNTVSTLALYRSFEIGKMSIVAPLSASYPVLTLMLSMLTGERLTLLRLAGIIVTIAGVVLVASGEKIPEDANLLDEEVHPGKKNLGAGWALLSAIGFGVMFWLLGIRVVPALGAAPSVWTIRATSVCATLLVMSLARQSIAPASKKDVPWIFPVGLLDTSAYVFNNYGMQHEQVSVVSVLASLYGAVTVALAAMLLREHISRPQWLGIIAIFVGVVLLSR
jgi:drug/metabolite transporter (DMT)-like permease